MDIFAVLFLTLVSVLVGVILTLVTQYYILYIYLKRSPVAKPHQKNNNVVYSLPEALKKQLESEDIHSKNVSSSLPISLVLQFLYHELRHSEAIKSWLYKKLSLEFDELLTKTTIGKFFESINIKDMNLGNQFPDIKNITVDDVKLDKKDGHIDTVSLGLNVDYTGNFLLSVDAKMKFGKTAYLSIKVKRVCGLVRLQFTRQPYTHWSFSFYSDPIVDLAVESHFQGRQLQSNITNLIVNQIKKAIKRKHTLPNYKIRYKPFFIKTDPSQLDSDDTEIVPQGLLEVNCIELSRLAVSSEIQAVYCTMAVDSIPWISAYVKDDGMYLTLEITMTKLRQTQLGVIFKQDQSGVIVDSVTPHSSAAKSGLKVGDIILAVESKAANAVPQVAKLIRSVSSANITFKVERFVENYSFKCKHEKIEPNKVGNVPVPVQVPETEQDSDPFQPVPPLAPSTTDQDSFVIVENNASSLDGARIKSRATSAVDKIKACEKVPKLISNSENVSKIAQTLGNFSLRKRKTSFSERPSNDNSSRNTPSSSTPGTPQHAVAAIKQHAIPTPVVSLNVKKHSISEVPEIIRTDLESSDSEILSGCGVIVEVQKGRELSSNTVLSYNEEYQFNLRDGMKYLNVNVWGTRVDDEKDFLLGYINIPLSHILTECCNCVLGHYIRSYSFLPSTNISPNSQNHPLMSHSGFEHVFCYGDVLLSFIWNHDDDVELKSKPSSSTISDSDILDISINNKKHDFIRTQFHRTTHCDFCSKKIWLKDAVQCKECGLCCHKKCVAKCQTSTACVSDKCSVSKETDVLHSDQGSGVNDSIEDVVSDGVGCHGDNLKTSGAGAMKRVNSVNNLAIPGVYVSPNLSRSLPPSPQRTPSRKQSLVTANPFAACPGVLDEIMTRPDESQAAVDKLLIEIMQCSSDEGLMDLAKETGQQLYVAMTHDEKMEKVNLMMGELKKALDAVTLEHMELSRKINGEESEVEKAKIAFLLGQADAKVQGLSVLMLHYCSSLQHPQNKIV